MMALPVPQLQIQRQRGSGPMGAVAAAACGIRAGRQACGVRMQAWGVRMRAGEKKVWVWTRNKDVMKAAVERGWTTFVFTPQTQGLAEAWNTVARIEPLLLRDRQFYDKESNQVAVLGEVASGNEQDVVRSLVGKADIVVMDALEWQMIPAENMVAAFQNSPSSIFATASSAMDAKLCFEALETGTDGILLKTEDPAEVFDLKAYLQSRIALESRVKLTSATVTRVEPVGMGDRVCVDLCSLLRPGEGLLVGSFARALFLVHSECLESSYIASRPFRVNAGPVHAYVAMPGGRTSYLSELRTGVEVLVADESGQTRSVLVGRLKIESRPLMLVEAEADGSQHSLLLQNAETVCLVQPSTALTENEGSLAIPVTSLRVEDTVLLSIQGGARHTGIQVQEFVLEK